MFQVVVVVVVGGTVMVVVVVVSLYDGGRGQVVSLLAGHLLCLVRDAGHVEMVARSVSGWLGCSIPMVWVLQVPSLCWWELRLMVACSHCPLVNLTELGCVRVA